MNKSYLLITTILMSILIILASILIFSASYFPLKINTKQIEKRISEVEKGPNVIKKEILLNTYIKQANFEKALSERDIAYEKLVKTVAFSVIFIALFQLVWLIYKYNKSM